MRKNMNCKICGAKDIQPSFGGMDICGRCDCGFHPDGTRWSFKETVEIGNNVRNGIFPASPSHE